MMTTTEHSTLIAIFADREQANQAIDTLRRAGYSYDQIRLVQRGANSFVENVKSLFTGQTLTDTNSADDWMRIGVPEQDARNYQSELDNGRSIVLLKAVENPEQALGLIRQGGAYDIAVHLRMAEPPAVGKTPNDHPMARNPEGAPVTTDPNTRPPVYDPNIPPMTTGPNTRPPAYDPNVPPPTRDSLNQPGQEARSQNRVQPTNSRDERNG